MDNVIENSTMTQKAASPNATSKQQQQQQQQQWPIIGGQTPGQTIALGIMATAGTLAVGVAHRIYKDYKSETYNINDPREQMSRQLVMRGHASIDEILRASYGEWPVKGLDIVTQHDQRVDFHKLVDWKRDPSKGLINDITDKLRVYLEAPIANATLAGDRKIGINHTNTMMLPQIFNKSALSGTLGHEVTHILQGDHSDWRADKTFGMTGPVYDHFKGVRSDEIAKSAFHSDNIKTEKFNVWKLTETSSKHLSYLQRGIEIQARLHEAAAKNYQQWGRMPLNREELLVAMKGAGLNVPKNIMDDLEKSPTIEDTKAVFGKGQKSISSRDINTALGVLNEKGRAHFWNNSIPELYSDMIEMYGDKLGRERFGLGTNPLPEVKAKSAAIIADGPRMIEEMMKSMGMDIDGNPLPAAPEAKALTADKAHIETPAASVADGHGKARGGLVANILIGSAAGAYAYKSGASLEESGKVTIQTMIPYSEAAMKAAQGDTQGAVKATITETAGIAGAVGGAAIGAKMGAAIGATIGTVIPGVGTLAVGAAGGLVGGIVGGIAGGLGMGMATDAALDKNPSITEKISKKVTSLASHFSKSVPGTPAQVEETQTALLKKAGFETVEQNGKKVSVAEILRDPARRDGFIAQLEKTGAESKNPDVKSNIEKLVTTARDFSDLESTRRGMVLDKYSRTTPDAAYAADVTARLPQQAAFGLGA